MNDILASTYDRINTNSVPIAQDELNGPVTYCKAVWTTGKWIHSSFFLELIEDLRSLGDECILFDTSECADAQLHWTLFQLQTFPVEPRDTKYVIEDGYKIKHILGQFPAFHIQYKGISKTRYGLFLNGYPTINVNNIRNKIRETISDIVEPHPQDICHTTLLRFIKPPSKLSIQRMDHIIEKYKNIELTSIFPDIWEYGYGTWLQKEKKVCVSWKAHPKWILHRGLSNGPDVSKENNEELIEKKLQEGWDIELDVWFIDNEWWVGHDEPYTKLQNIDLLTHKQCWIHCKNLEALCNIPHNSHYFCHDKDVATLTSHACVWLYPGHFVEGTKTVIVLPERANMPVSTILKASAVCSDYLPSHFYIE